MQSLTGSADQHICQVSLQVDIKSAYITEIKRCGIVLGFDGSRAADKDDLAGEGIYWNRAAQYIYIRVGWNAHARTGKV